VRERENLHVERDIDLWIVSIDEIVEVDLSEEEVMLTKKQERIILDFLQEISINRTFKNGKANGRRGKLVVA